MNLISFIIPSRNNLKYLKQAYHSIRTNTEHQHEICIASDFSDDGTVEWAQEIMETDSNVKLHINDGPTRLGHTILYDTLINDYASHDRVIIFHADMVLCPGADEEIDKYLEPGVVVSLTRIEPPLHPPGPEKIIADYGIEPEEFDTEKFLQELPTYKQDKVTEGIFAPWAIMKEDFQSIGGHDPLFAPQSKEDSDIFNRFLLNGYRFVQTWKGFVYHMTCRGSRFKDGAMRNPDGQVFMKGRESDEWLAQNQRSTRNFIRKWGHFVRHDSYMKPIVPHKYDIGFVIDGLSTLSVEHGVNILQTLEPWCSKVYVDVPETIDEYINSEQPNTDFDLNERVQHHMILRPDLWTKESGVPEEMQLNHDIVVRFNCFDIDQDSMNVITQLADILDDSGEIGNFELGIFNIEIKSIKYYEKELIAV